ncbi:hypothetical protein AAK882_02625 [Carnobacteriaceae bacterium 52-44]
MNNKNEEKKIKREFWIAFGFFMSIVVILILAYLILSTLNFFG